MNYYRGFVLRTKLVVEELRNDGCLAHPVQTHFFFKLCKFVFVCQKVEKEEG